MKYSSKRLLVKIKTPYRLFKRAFSLKMPVLSPMQKSALKVTMSIIRAKESTLLIDPITGVRYARYREFKIKFGSNFIFINRIYNDDGQLPHNISNYFELNYVTGERLIRYFDLYVSKRRQAMEAEDDALTFNNLEQMYECIVKYTNENHI